MSDVLSVQDAVVLLCISLSLSVLIIAVSRLIRTLSNVPRRQRHAARQLPEKPSQIVPVSTLPGKQELLVEELGRYQRQQFSVPIQTRARSAETWPVLKRRIPAQQTQQANKQSKG